MIIINILDYCKDLYLFQSLLCAFLFYSLFMFLKMILHLN